LLSFGGEHVMTCLDKSSVLISLTTSWIFPSKVSRLFMKSQLFIDQVLSLLPIDIQTIQVVLSWHVNGRLAEFLHVVWWAHDLIEIARLKI
jgi:hypothetical protein